MALDLSKPLRTKADHRKAILLEQGGLTKVAVKEPDGWVVCSWAFPADVLENVPETRELDCWVNVYESGCNTMYATKDRADTAAEYDRGARCAMRIACLHIQRTYEVGEGLS